MTTEQITPAPSVDDSSSVVDSASVDDPVDGPAHPSRRHLLLGGAAVATSVVAGEALASEEAAAAFAAPSYPIRRYRKTRIPSPAQLHMMNRMGCGFSRTTWTQMKKAGGATSWFNRQLNHTHVAENAKTSSLLDWFPDLRQSAKRKRQVMRDGTKGNWEYARDLANYTTLRRIYSNRQVFENMVEFWSNHLHVPATHEMAWPHRFGYDQMIRRHALGRYDELLLAATLHPAMLLNLDNWRSVRNAANENHGRELLELHTVGRTSGYTEAMVRDAAIILSGHTVGVNGSWEPYYDAYLHTMGRVQVLGFSHANTTARGGPAVVRGFIRYLAHHPATARTIARKMAVRFVSDEPSAALVNHLAGVYLRSGTDIKATLRALVAHSEFKRAHGNKVRTPVEDLVSTVRVLQINATRPTSINGFAHGLAYLHQGLRLYHWPRPDGPPDRNSAWASATRMLSSFRMHWNLGGGYYPTRNVVYRKPRSWLPQRRIRLDLYVDHMCRMLHGKGSTSRQLTAVCQATGHRPRTIITRDHPIADWLFVRVVAVLLDGPTHMSR